jgi:hypothetical protein
VLLDDLRQHILTLANLGEATEPVVSCYLDLGSAYRENLNDRVRSLKNQLEQRMRLPFWEALGRIEVFVGTGIHPESRGAAVFSRGGEHSFFLPLQFAASLPTRVTVNARPHIYHLVELKHDYSRRTARTSGIECARLEEEDSLALPEKLYRAMSASGLAVGGTLASLKALREGWVRELLLSRSYAPDPGWLCRGCEGMLISFQRPSACSRCGGRMLRELDPKEELVRVAEQRSCPIRMVAHSDGMKAIGGVGCLLSQPATERFDRPAA